MNSPARVTNCVALRRGDFSSDMTMMSLVWRGDAASLWLIRPRGWAGGKGGVHSRKLGLAFLYTLGGRSETL